ncbi:hypothetical protein SPRG_01929 [Saprolegnia parasitica CBS 223.65]|uniref:Uncharacterized protein n=1 Tax=Saprolegnia parasitica (strain CBS 223.65) TaxID=695850 RepID=A0A067D282_SAPPC|nr:hypothetical protein SPRG_01929 [Saprolegnia parasitica CBS 223.65]KDO33117.1 hypothetical protein SPRG_01929 [Saprolegnia parasitica CBS 223.65]|eukprot:XP_012195884.1 hypothetical protein SPRG_01929 [Saprolegnia parasitica CBS 223.65]
MLQPPSLLTLPTDVRGHIYSFLLGGRLRHGFRSSSTNLLAWVGTCRAIYDDVQATQLTELAMDFATTQAFLDTIPRLPQHVLRQVKHVRMIGYLLPLHPVTQAFARPCDAINFFPALQLDSLLVEDYFHGPKRSASDDDYLSDEMTRHQVTYLLATDGWTSLQYVSYATGFLSLAGANQVGMWDQFLKDSYGENASVTVYVAKEAAPDAYHVLRNDPARVLSDLTQFEAWTPEMAQKAPRRLREVRILATRDATKPRRQTCKAMDIASDAFRQQYLWATTIADDARSSY